MRTLPVLLLALSGCASIFASNSETIRFETEPAGQRIEVDGQSYTAPADVVLGREKEHVVRWPDGSESVVERTTNGWFVANVIWFPVGMIVGMVVDLGTGKASANLTPELLVWRSGEGVVKPAPKRSGDGNPKVTPRYP